MAKFKPVVHLSLVGDRLPARLEFEKAIGKICHDQAAKQEPRWLVCHRAERLPEEIPAIHNHRFNRNGIGNLRQDYKYMDRWVQQD